MGQQLIIPNFKKPLHITIDDVFNRMAEEVEYDRPSNKEIRLAIDLAKQISPLFQFNLPEQTETVRRICKYDISDDMILNVKPFKQILFKEVIIGVEPLNNGKFKVKLKRVRRR